MKSYSLELVQRKSGSSSLGKLSTAVLLGVGVYTGYKRLKSSPTTKSAGAASTKDFAYDAGAHEGEDFTARILKAAKNIIK